MFSIKHIKLFQDSLNDTTVWNIQEELFPVVMQHLEYFDLTPLDITTLLTKVHVTTILTYIPRTMHFS